MNNIFVGDRQFNSLNDVDKWAWKEQPEFVSIRAEGIIPSRGARWTYPAPKGVEIIGGSWSGYENRMRAKGWWLKYQPDKTGGPLTVKNVAVYGYLSGGLSAAATLNGSAEPSGEKVWLRRVTIHDASWTDIYGYGAIYLQGVKDFDISRNDMRNIGNKWTTHAVYVTDRSGPGRVIDTKFYKVYGDPVRARDGSIIKVNRCVSLWSGRNGLASSWTAPGEDMSKIHVVNSEARKTRKGKDAELLSHIQGNPLW